jgi:GNAT superfamily N-acetyltransferase
MRKVRESVHENRLTSTRIADADYLRAIGADGRGWVIEIQSKIVAFAVGNSVTGNIWALFVHPDHEGRGYGRRLHDVMIDWLFTQGAQRLWLTTDPDTRAQRFYESAGWRFVGRTDFGELRYELWRPQGRMGNEQRRSDYESAPTRPDLSESGDANGTGG